MIPSVARFRLLPHRERAAVLRAVVCLAAAYGVLRVCSYAFLRRWIDRVPPRRRQSPGATAADCERAVRRASRVLPLASCLAQALAAGWMLRRDGRASTIVIGVKLDETRQLQAHAWLESEDIIVTGSRLVNGHVPLLRDAIVPEP